MQEKDLRIISALLGEKTQKITISEELPLSFYILHNVVKDFFCTQGTFP